MRNLYSSDVWQLLLLDIQEVTVSLNAPSFFASGIVMACCSLGPSFMPFCTQTLQNLVSGIAKLCGCKHPSVLDCLTITHVFRLVLKKQGHN